MQRSGCATGTMIALAAMLCPSSKTIAGTLTEPVNYQGQLSQSGQPVTGLCDLEFELWDAIVNGSQIGASIERLNVDLENGLFQVELPFAPESFNGNARWLEIAVRCPALGTRGGRFTTLIPRERITFTPYALQTRGFFVDSAKNVGIGTSAPAYDLHVRTSGSIIGGASETTVGLHNSFLAGLDVVNRWFDMTVGANVSLSLHPTADLNIVRRQSQSSQFGTSQLFLKSQGQVGIGTSQPEEMLHISVPSSAIDAFIKLSAPDEDFIFQSGLVMCAGTDTAFENCAGFTRNGTGLDITNQFGFINMGTTSIDLFRLATGFPNHSAIIGEPSEQTDLTVNGDVTITGNVDMRYTHVDSGWVAGSTQTTVVCPAGTKVIGGGCETQGNADVVKRTYPGSDAGWICVFELANSNHRAHAICAGVE